MKTMTSDDRTLLEDVILRALCGRPDWWGLFDLTALDFKNKHTRKIFKFLMKLIQDNQEVNLIAFANNFEIAEVKHLFDGELGPIISAKEYTEACAKLREDTIRHEIVVKLEECGNSTEYVDFIDTVRKLNTIGTLESFEENVRLYGEEYQKIADRKADNGGALISHWQRFGKMTSMFPGDYVVLGARTSIGKTSFALSFAIDVASLGQRVLFLSSEMSRKHIFDKIAAMLMQEPVWKFKFAHKPFPEVKKAMETLAANWNFQYEPSLSTSTIRGIMRKAGKVDLVVIDYLQLLKDFPRKNDTENLRLGRISGALKQMAGEFQTVFFVAAQLNRDSEKQKRPPVLSDLRDSGCIEQDADIVCLLHRENREDPSARLIVAKNRTGEVGDIDFLFNPEWSYFREVHDGA